MKVLGINRAEVLVSDPDAAQATFTRLFNGAHFTADARKHRRPIECRHDWQHGLELVHPETADDVIGQKLQRFGEGHLLTVVYEVESLDDARRHLQANGFEIQYEGDYSAHPDVEVYRQLVVRPETAHGFFVTFMERRWKPHALRTVSPVDPDGLRLSRISRAEILVRDGAAAARTFTRMFGGGEFRIDRVDHGYPIECRVDWAHGLELVEPTDPGHPLGRLLAERGEGHVLTVVYDVEDLDAARGYLQRNGFAVQYEADYGGHDDFLKHRQLVVGAAGVHGFPITLMEAGRSDAGAG
jgi:hypothetical protein